MMMVIVYIGVARGGGELGGLAPPREWKKFAQPF